jgi:hypothetical protein
MMPTRGAREVVHLLNSTVSNFSEFSLIVDTKALPQLTKVDRAVASTNGRPLWDVPEQLEDRLCHILVQPKPCNVTKESLFDASTCIGW